MATRTATCEISGQHKDPAFRQLKPPAAQPAVQTLFGGRWVVWVGCMLSLPCSEAQTHDVAPFGLK